MSDDDAPARPAEPRRALVVIGHPRGADSLCGALAAAWAEGARAAGWTVEIADLGAMAFDADLRAPSPRLQPLEPDLVRLRDGIEAAAHLVLVFPTWWGTFPARLKGALDRVLVPGRAFREIEGGTGYEGLLPGRTAELITTMDTPGFVYGALYGAPGRRALARATLGFCGIETVRFTRFGTVKDADDAARGRWIATARAAGARMGRGPRGPLRRLGAAVAPWAAALRLQFHPMAVIAYAVGALAAAERGRLDAAAFWSGALAVLLLEAAAVFVNDLNDLPSDARNRFWSPFTGGSRVLVTGALSARALRRGAATAFALSAAAAGLALAQPGAATLWGAAVYAALALLAIGYTAPPLRLCWRGWGELDVAVTHSFGVMLLGAAAQGAGPEATAPWLLSAPLALAVLPAILLSGVPDRDADAAAGKRTLAVRLGVRGAMALAAAAAIAAAATAAALHAAGAPALGAVAWVAPPHAAALVALIVREARRGDAARRLDGVMAAALGYILWFAALPLLALM